MAVNLKKYWLVWLTTAKLSVQSSFENRFAAAFFISGKLIRFGLFVVFLLTLSRQVQMIGGYTLKQMVIFFLIFNLFDMFGQIFFRGIGWFREQVINGEFDFRLIKPMNALFQALTRQTDILDLPLFIVIVIYLLRQPLNLNFYSAIGFILVSLAACLTITAIHVVIAALGVVTTEVDHTIMIYRDLSAMARFPVDIYVPYIRLMLTFVVPISLAFTLPAKILLGLINPLYGGIALLISLGILSVTLFIWNTALRSYSSASS